MDLVDEPVADPIGCRDHRVDAQVESLTLQLDDFVDDEGFGHARKRRDQVPETTRRRPACLLAAGSRRCDVSRVADADRSRSVFLCLRHAPGR